MEVIVENNEVRCAHTLKLIAKSFEVDGVTYYVPIKR
jgi:hypothetical protein